MPSPATGNSHKYRMGVVVDGQRGIACVFEWVEQVLNAGIVARASQGTGQSGGVQEVVQAREDRSSLY